MRAPVPLRAVLFALAMSSCVGGALAQAAPAPSAYEPSVGQEGKDVVWVPTPQALVDKMLDLAKVTPADLFESDFSKASVITMFLLDRINLQLRPKLLGLRPGTRLVSNTFTMGDWAADEQVNATEREGCQSYCAAYLWNVPAKVGGTWTLPQGELTLKQEFQTISGLLKAGDKVLPVTGRLRGDRIMFKAGGADYAGRVTGDSIEGFGKGPAALPARTQALNDSVNQIRHERVPPHS